MQTFDLEYDFLNGTTLTDKDLPLLMEELKKKLKYGINCSIPITVLINSQQFHLIYHKGSLKFLKDKTKETSDYQQWLNEIEQENWNANRDTPESFHKELSEEQEARNLERQERLEDGKGADILNMLMPIYSESQLEELKKQQLEQDLAFWNKSNQYQGGEAYKVESKQEPSVTSHSMVFLDMSNLKEDLSFEEATKELKQRRKGFTTKSEYPLTPEECFPGTNMGTIDIKLDKAYFLTDEEKKDLTKQFFPPLPLRKTYQHTGYLEEAGPINKELFNEEFGTVRWVAKDKLQDNIKKILEEAEAEKAKSPNNTFKVYPREWLNKEDMDFEKEFKQKQTEKVVVDIIKNPRQKGKLNIAQTIALIWKQLNTKI